MGVVGVKLVAAPDAPLRGEVLVRTPVDQPHGTRRCAASTDIHVLRGFHVRPVLARGQDASGSRAGQSDKYGNAHIRNTLYRRASEGDEARGTTNAAEDTRQRASGGRTCGRARTLGRTP